MFCNVLQHISVHYFCIAIYCGIFWAKPVTSRYAKIDILITHLHEWQTENIVIYEYDNFCIKNQYH